MFERLTDRGRQAILHAQEASIAMQHGYIGCEHLLLGLCRQGDGVAGVVLGDHGVGAALVHDAIVERFGTASTSPVSAEVALASLGIDLAEVKRRIEASFGEGALPTGEDRPPFTVRAKEALERSLDEARDLQHEYIGTEHLLLGLLHDDGNMARAILVGRGIDLDALRRDVIAAAASDHLRTTAAEAKLRQLFRLYLDPATRDVVEAIYEQTATEVGAARAQASAARVRLVKQLADDLETAIAHAEESLAGTGLALDGAG